MHVSAQKKTVFLSAPIPEQLAGMRLDKVVSQLFPDYSRTQHKEWIISGAVEVEGEIEQNPRKSVEAGETVKVQAVLLEQASAIPQELPLVIVHEEDSFFVIEKPAGLVVHPGAGNSDSTLLNALLHRDKRLAYLPRAGLIHRLDKDTSGLLLVARSEGAYQSLTRQMQARQIKREYEAIVQGRVIAGGTIDLPLGRHPRLRTQRAVVVTGKPAVTHYRVLSRFLQHTHLGICLETGRTHQIRVHLSHLGYSVVGDQLYTKRKASLAGLSAAAKELVQSFPRQALHAVRLSFLHPLSEREVVFQSALPLDISNLLSTLGASHL